MENKKEMTIPNVSAATDAEQSLSKCTDNSIVNQDTDFKGYEQSFEEMQREILRQLDPSYLKTVSMTTLYDTVFEVQTPLIDGLLQRGTYLFVGSPKVGKSFMMHSLPIISAQAHRFGSIRCVRQRCFILPLKMITHVCRSDCFRCSVQRRQAICISQRNVKRSMADWKNR